MYKFESPTTHKKEKFHAKSCVQNTWSCQNDDKLCSCYYNFFVGEKLDSEAGNK